MYKSYEDQPTDITGMLYRNGFIVSEIVPNLSEFGGWKSVAVGRLWVTSHPETSVLSASHGDRTITLVGSAFDPEERVFDEAAILQALLAASSSADEFNLCLDRLAGRFALVVDTAKGTEIYHDAMGSRSVFYSVAGPAVAASHAEIVAKLSNCAMADYFIPFITSRNYVQRDVKYLPGLLTPYNDVLQLTPNTKLKFGPQTVERYWPREEMGPAVERADAAGFLAEHLSGMTSYLESKGSRPAVGLTAGTDSRGVFAAVKNLNPFLFTYVRSEKGDILASKDARIAQEIADVYRLPVHIWGIPNRLTLKQVDNEFSYVFRRVTGYYRGAGSPWLQRLQNENLGSQNATFVRGFGGEVMRGFYQLNSKRISRINEFQFSDTYDINAGSSVTRNAFGDMIERTNLNDETRCGYDANDLFYWEHRMGTWGSVAMTEADLALPSLVAYNSRNLFSMYMALDESERSSRVGFDMATTMLAPALNGKTFK